MQPSPDTGVKLADHKLFSNAVRNAELPVPKGVVGPDGKLSIKRFSVYRNNVASSLIEALASNFPAIQRLLGEDFFAAVAQAYISEQPPKIPMLFLYGDKFGEFLRGFEPVADYPYLDDVAQFEFAWLQSYHAKNQAILDPAALALVAPVDLGNCRFQVHPATWIFRSDWPSATLVTRNRDEADCSDINLSQGEDILITRPSLDVLTRVLPEGAYPFLAALIAGDTLEQAAETALAANQEFDLSAQITGMLDSGVFCAITNDD